MSGGAKAAWSMPNGVYGVCGLQLGPATRALCQNRTFNLTQLRVWGMQVPVVPCQPGLTSKIALLI